MHSMFLGWIALAGVHSDAQAPAAGANAQVQAAAPVSDRDAVRAAVNDYLESIYKVEPDRVKRSVGTDLNKLGHYYGADGNGKWSGMSFTQLVDLAGTYYAKSGPPADAPRKIELLDVGSRIANAKLTASWGIDYLLLTKDPDNVWRIRQVLWEGPPPKAK